MDEVVDNRSLGRRRLSAIDQPETEIDRLKEQVAGLRRQRHAAVFQRRKNTFHGLAERNDISQVHRSGGALEAMNLPVHDLDGFGRIIRNAFLHLCEFG